MDIKDTIGSVVDAAVALVRHDDGKATDDEPGIERDHPADEDAIALLKDDHKRIRATLEDILGDKSLALSSKRKNVAAVLADLALHAKIEEKFLYAAVYDATKRESEDRLKTLEAYEEHGSIAELMRKIKRTKGRDESLKAKVQVLSELVDHHFKEEESEFFGEAKRLLGHEELAELGAAISKYKARVARAAAPRRGRRSAAKKVASKRARSTR